MTDEIVTTEAIRLGTLEIPPQTVIARATQIATELANIINARKLYVPISGKKYVRVEGWTTLGAMLGVTPREVKTITHEDGTFEATVEIIRPDGKVIGRGSAICGLDEPAWAKRPANARRSMAITRATGKAFRLAYSWIMTLAGYEATPAEEIIDADSHPAEPLNDVDISFPKVQKPAPLKGSAAILQTLVDLGIAENIPSASAIVNGLGMVGKPDDVVIAKSRIYRGWRDSGLDSKEAFARTIAGKTP